MGRVFLLILLEVWGLSARADSCADAPIVKGCFPPRPHVIMSRQTPSSPQDATLSPDQSWIIIPWTDGTLVAHNLKTGRELQWTRYTKHAKSVQFFQDGKKFLVQGVEGKVGIFDLRTGKVKTYKSDPFLEYPSIMTPNGRYLATQRSIKKKAHLILVDTKKNTQRLSVPVPDLKGRLQFSPGGTYLSLTSHHHEHRLFHVSTGKPVELPGASKVSQMDFTPDDKGIIALSDDLNHLQIFSEKGKILLTQENVSSFFLSPDGKWLVIKKRDDTTYLYPANPPYKKPPVRLPEPADSMKFSSDGKWLYATERERSGLIKSHALYRVGDWKPTHNIDWFNRGHFSRNSEYLITDEFFRHSLRKVRIQNLKTMELSETLSRNGNSIILADQIDKSSQWLVSPQSTGSIIFRNLNTKDELTFNLDHLPAFTNGTIKEGFLLDDGKTYVAFSYHGYAVIRLPEFTEKVCVSDLSQEKAAEYSWMSDRIEEALFHSCTSPKDRRAMEKIAPQKIQTMMGHLKKTASPKGAYGFVDSSALDVKDASPDYYAKILEGARKQNAGKKFHPTKEQAIRVLAALGKTKEDSQISNMTWLIQKSELEFTQEVADQFPFDPKVDQEKIEKYIENNPMALKETPDLFLIQVYRALKSYDASQTECKTRSHREDGTHVDFTFIEPADKKISDLIHWLGSYGDQQEANLHLFGAITQDLLAHFPFCPDDRDFLTKAALGWRNRNSKVQYNLVCGMAESQTLSPKPKQSLSEAYLLARSVGYLSALNRGQWYQQMKAYGKLRSEGRQLQDPEIQQLNRGLLDHVLGHPSFKVPFETQGENPLNLKIPAKDANPGSIVRVCKLLNHEFRRFAEGQDLEEYSLRFISGTRIWLQDLRSSLDQHRPWPTPTPVVSKTLRDELQGLKGKDGEPDDLIALESQCETLPQREMKEKSLVKLEKKKKNRRRKIPRKKAPSGYFNVNGR